MAVTTTAIGVGAAADDGTGDTARVGGQTINTNTANLDAAVELLQSAGFEVINATHTTARGEKLLCNAHAGFTVTLPAATTTLDTDAYNDIWIINVDGTSDVTLDPDGTDEIHINSAGQGAGTNVALETGYLGILLNRQDVAGWDLLKIPVRGLTIDDISGFALSGEATGDILEYDGADYANVTKEAADIVERDVPALEVTPYLKHESRSARASGTETITCADDPSVYLPVGGNNVTINLDVPALSLPVRGLNDVKLAGKVFVKMNGAYSGLTVTTDAGTKLSTFPKGTAPSASGEWGILVWEWFDDGTVDFMWAEWVNDA